jgi:hypothetical protein
MKLGTEDKKKLGILAIVGVFALGAAFYMYSQLSTPDAPPPAAPVVLTTPAPVGTAAAKRRTTPSGNVAGVSAKPIVVTGEAQLDPTLHMEAMLVTESLVYSGSGRNIFSANSAPEVVIPKLVAKVRTPEPIAAGRLGPTGPPPPPPIDLKFFGTETNALGQRRAFLLHGEDVFLVSSGDMVQRRYRVISIDARSIMIEDIANNNRQTLPLLAN